VTPDERDELRRPGVQLEDLPRPMRQPVAAWLEGRAPATRAAYLRDLADVIAIVGASSAYEISSDDLRRLVATLRESELAAASVRRKIGTVKSFFAWAVREGILSRNPAIRTKTPLQRPRSAPSRTPDVRVIVRALSRARGPRGALFRLAYVTGAGPNELAGIRWSDIRAVDGRGRVRVGDRDVEISASTYAALLRDRDGRPADLWVWSGRNGERATARTIERAIARAALELGAGELSLRELRWAHELHAIERGAPEDVVAATLGRRRAFARRRTPPKFTSSALYLPC